MKKDVYYIGFNANNAICNEMFFAGSITLYPTKEKGNIYYSDKALIDTKSDEFLNKYRDFIYTNAKKIQKMNKNSIFFCFNEKIRNLCKNMSDIKFVNNNNEEIINFLNDKFKTRDIVKDYVPILDYSYYKQDDLDYKKISNELKSSKFVVQGKKGAGGDSTYLIECCEDLERIKCDNTDFCVSKYVKHLPLNITIIIQNENIILLPISVQLILLTNNKFKYVGGDFCFVSQLDENVIRKVLKYSEEIGNIVKEKGYRGILGIDYILTEDDEILFMETNPRFQASTFLISKYLEDNLNTNVAELHFNALNGKKSPNVKIEKIDKSFVNCNEKEEFNKLEPNEIVTNGYFRDNISSIYRKVFNKSIVEDYPFEKNF